LYNKYILKVSVSIKDRRKNVLKMHKEEKAGDIRGGVR